MDISKTKTGDKITIFLSGRLDTATAPQLQNVLTPVFDETDVITLDFTDIVYISSAGLRVLLLGQKTAKAKSAVMTLCGVSEGVMEVLDMTGFSDMLTIV